MGRACVKSVAQEDFELESLAVLFSFDFVVSVNIFVLISMGQLTQCL